MTTYGKRKPDGTWDTPTGNHPGGQEPYFDSPEAMQSLIDQYFIDCDNHKLPDNTPQPLPYTIPGMAYALGFTSRQAILNYDAKPEFVSTLKRARLKIEGQRNGNMVAGKGSPVGAIFDLKNNFGWIDEQTVKHDVVLSIDQVEQRIRLLTQSHPELVELAQEAEIIENEDEDSDK